ncbi:MAG TPA: efflux RND transporter periplasmic adaptor subunit [Allosphingosinicella sp.]|jgi:RND family efflux transporter MFP subunit
MRKDLLGAAALLLLAAGCSGSGDEANQAEAQAPAVDETRGASVAVTHYTDVAEMFVEYRPLTVGVETSFAAHMSWLPDYRSINEGQLVVELVRGNGQVERVATGVSDTPGIFRPKLTPKTAGPARLVLRLAARGKVSVHDLGPVTVYATREQAKRANPEQEDDPGLISFTKEAQWRIPFAAAPAVLRALEATLPVTVDVRLAPDAEAIVAAPVAGIVRVGGAVPGPGTSVRAGQVLATLSAQLGVGQDLATLDLDISRARINVQAAQREVGRMNRLYRAEAVPQRRLQEAQTALRLAQAELSAASSRRSSLAGGGAGVPLVAPISGRILSSSLVRGGAVQAGAELMRIGNPDRIWLVAHVPEAQAGAITSPGGLDLIRPGGDATLVVGNQLRLVQGRTVVDPQTRTMDVIFASSGMGLSPGQRLQGRLRTGFGRNALSVPASAVINENGQNVVYVQVEGEAFERRLVQLGIRSGDFVEIRGDVRPGERVVTVGATSVRAAAASPASFGEGHAH